MRRLDVAVLVLVLAASACAKSSRRKHLAEPPPLADPSFCGAAFSPLPGGCAYVPPSIASPTSVVYYAHGMLAEGARPAHELEVVRAAADLYGFAVVAPRGRKGLCTWSEEVKSNTCWPSRRDAVDQNAREILGEWIGAEHEVSKRIGRRFARHYALGFSNGGYFIAYVAADGMLQLDGAAIIGAGRTDVDDAHLAKTPIPIFVGVGSDEPAFTLDSAARLAGDLSAHGWPVDVTVHEDRGHELDEDDIDLAWLAWSH